MKPVYHIEQLPLFPTKVCTICGKEKFLDPDFPRNKTVKKDGHDPRCKQCREEYHAQYREKNAEKLRAYDRWRNVTPERREEKTRAERIKRRSDPDRAKKNRARLQRWQVEHPFAARERTMRSHAKLHGVYVEIVDYAGIVERDGMICHICQGIVAPDDIHFDHVLPPSRGGSHTFDNIKIAHSVCNIRKGSFLIEELEPFHRRGPDVP